MSAHLRGFSKYLPERVVNNQELASRLGCTTQWIEESSGIHERRWAAPEESIADMAVAAAKNNELATKPGLLLLSSGSAATQGFPGPAAEVADRLGWGGMPAIDLPIASAGSIFGLSLAASLAPTYGSVLLIASEKMSSIIESHPLDANTAILFGDGAGAVEVSATSGPWKIASSVLHSDGQFRESLSYRGTGALSMNGLSVILQASRKLPSVIAEALAACAAQAKDVEAFLLHQANKNLITRVAKSLEVPAERFFSNIDAYGNTSSASMLIAAADYQPRVGKHVFAGFGAGFHWGAVAADYTG